ncbi:flagellar biosynthetic protein FliR [Paenibacillus aurantius]|uniref:Flagellar biosynthetic protein FliR n=1 Tax=Paenibacillus aurantius TaxID=2918900 RepID=A0AA96LJ17_9BACL|nr:flagellar biosynthetic protein FliR [Paenibacillus aurantius]WNQ14228.1 flagellar biosynthetic protein FliR [Paenibacillus aurantius]
MEPILQAFPSFLLVFCRIAAFFVAAPVFSARNVPTPFKLGISFFVSLIVLTLVSGAPVPMDGNYVLSILKETLIGLLLGFVAYVFFAAVQIAGSFVDIQIGFSIANIIDPMTGAGSPILGNLKYMLATVLFLAFNGHHYLFSAIIDSYQWVPLDNQAFERLYQGGVTEFLVRSLSTAFELAFQMAAPLVVALFLVDVGLGILARTAPQFNIFVLSMPLKILVGLMILILLIPGFSPLFSDLFQDMIDEVRSMIQLLGGAPPAQP